jgi:hypothetical protein
MRAIKCRRNGVNKIFPLAATPPPMMTEITTSSGSLQMKHESLW